MSEEPYVFPPLEQVLHHRGQMLLLDRVVEHDTTHTCCEVSIGPHSLFRQTDGDVPAWVGLEYMAQAMAAHVGLEARRLSEPIPMGLLLGTRRLGLHVRAFPAGQTLRIHAEASWADDLLTSFACRVTDATGSHVLADGQLNACRPTGQPAAGEDASS